MDQSFFPSVSFSLSDKFWRLCYVTYLESEVKLRNA